MDCQSEKRLLVVDDEDLLRASLVKLLTLKGYSVLSAPDGNEALRLIKENRFQLIITDLKMPGMNGMELLLEVKKLYPDTKIVILTAHGEWNTYLEAMEKGAFEYLNKPINKEELFSTVKKALQILLIFLLGMFFCGCGEQEKALKIKFNEIDTSTGYESLDRKQEVLRLAISSMISPRETIYCYQDIFDYVGEKLNRKIEILQKETYGETNELLRQGEVDVAMVCSGAYVEAHASYGAELLVAPKPLSDRTYCSYIIVHRDSQINSIEGLKGRTFAFTDSLSNTGRLYPVWLLSRKGYKPETYFSRYIYSGSHDNSIRAVSDGLIDGAAVDSLIFLYMNSNQTDVVSLIKVIAVSPVFGLPPLIVHPRMDTDFKKILREILLGMHSDEKGRVLLNKIKIERFIIPQDNDYDSIREMKKAVGYEKDRE